MMVMLSIPSTVKCSWYVKICWIGKFWFLLTYFMELNNAGFVIQMSVFKKETPCEALAYNPFYIFAGLPHFPFWLLVCSVLFTVPPCCAECSIHVFSEDNIMKLMKRLKQILRKMLTLLLYPTPPPPPPPFIQTLILCAYWQTLITF